MRKLKVGADIKTKQDIENLIKDLIDRSGKEFAASFIKNLANNYVLGSPLRIKPEAVDLMVDLILYDMQMENAIVCDSGLFVKVKQSGKTL